MYRPFAGVSRLFYSPCANWRCPASALALGPPRWLCVGKPEMLFCAIRVKAHGVYCVMLDR